MEQQIADARRQNATLSRKNNELDAALAAARQQIQDRLVSLGDMERRAEAAEIGLKAVLASSSWRMTAPYRFAGRLLLRRRAVAPVAIPIQNSDLTAKEVARRVFIVASSCCSRCRGMRRCYRILHSLAPGPVEWLMLRYRAYERRAAFQAAAQGVTPTPPAQGSSPDWWVSLDLSDEEARVYRQFARGGVSASVGTAAS